VRHDRHADGQVNLPPRPPIRTFWKLHRGIVGLTGGRFGLQRPERGARFGMLRLHTLGRRSGQARVAMVGYYEDGANLVTLAMNGWGTSKGVFGIPRTVRLSLPAADFSPSARSRTADLPRRRGPA
jgi:hypothetical protein